MSQIAKYSSSKEIIDRVYMNTGSSMELPYLDMITHIYDCMNKLGCPLQYRPKVLGYLEDDRLDFNQWKIPLPCDFYKLQYVLVNNVPAVPTTDAMHYLKGGECCGFTNLTLDQQGVITDNFGVTFSSNAAINPFANTYLPITFDMNDNFMTFNIKEGKVCMAYKSFPVDSEGYPMIPDDTKYKDAVTKYLIERVDYILWRQDMISDKIYEDSKNAWYWASGALSSHMKIPDELQMEVMKRELIKLVPRFNEFNTSYKNLGTDTQHL